MKKIISLIALSLVVSSGFAQNQAGQSVLTLNAGYSIIGNLFSTALESVADEGADISAMPVLIFAYDYGLTDNFSMGVFAGYQKTSADFSYSYGGALGDSTTETIEFSGSRLSIAIRPNLHYLEDDNLDLYSGLRVGWLIRNFDQNSTDDDFETLDIFDGSRFTLGLTLLGARYYFTDNIGINMEVGIGPPYAVNGGINFRF